VSPAAKNGRNASGLDNDAIIAVSNDSLTAVPTQTLSPSATSSLVAKRRHPERKNKQKDHRNRPRQFLKNLQSQRQ